MTKKVLVFSCLLGLIASLPANASPTNKKITLTCSSAANVITGTATVTVCDAAPVVCTGQTYLCGSVSCDSSGSSTNPTNTIACSAPFRVDGVSYNVSYVDSNGSSGLITGSTVLPNGSGYSVTTGAGSDTVTLKIK